MATSRYLPDRGLTARMVFTMFLLGLLFVVLGAVLVNYLGSLGLILIAGFLVAQWFFSDRVALYSMGGKEVSPQEAPELQPSSTGSVRCPTFRSRRSPSPTPTCLMRSPPAVRRRGPSSAPPPA